MTKSVLLIGGSADVGKTELTNFIAHQLGKNYQRIRREATGTHGKDWLYLFDGKDKNGNFVEIVVNTASDDPPSKTNLDSFLNTNSGDIIISAIRSKDPERTNVANIIHSHCCKNYSEIEIPLARLHGGRNNQSLPWYEQTREELAKHILELPPFNLKM